jgi:hypothetical protein
MKAILGNFKKISETEFQLKKTLQFAKVSLDSEGKVRTVDYEDKQNIEVGDILTHMDQDYEIKDINTDKFDYLQVKVAAIVQEQDVPDKSNFVPRKMTPRKPKKQPVVVEPIPLPEKKVEKILEKLEESEKEIDNTVKPMPKVTKPKKRSIIKRFAGWISSKLSSYSNS